MLKTARRIANKMVLVAFVNMDEELRLAGFTIVDQCQVNKRKFKRYITVCL